MRRADPPGTRRPRQGDGSHRACECFTNAVRYTDLSWQAQRSPSADVESIKAVNEHLQLQLTTANHAMHQAVVCHELH